MTRTIILLACSLAVAACSPPSSNTQQASGSSSATIEVPPASAEGDVAEGAMGELGPDGIGNMADEHDGRPDRVICKSPDGSVFLDDFGLDMDPSSGRITFTSQTTGEYTAAYGSCVMRGGSKKPEGWKPVIPGGYVPPPQPTATPQPAITPATPSNSR